MDIQTRIKNSQFRKDVLNILQSAKIHEKIEGASLINEIPVSSINDIYFSIISKIIQDISEHNASDNTKILHDIVLLALCKSRRGKKFDAYYNDIINDIDKNITLSNKIFIEV